MNEQAAHRVPRSVKLALLAGFLGVSWAVLGEAQSSSAALPDLGDTLGGLTSSVSTTVVSPIVSPVVESAVAPIVANVATPILDPVVKNVVAPVTTPVVTQVVAPVVTKVVQPISAQVVQPVVIEVVTPVLAPILSPVTTGIIEPLVNDVVSSVIAPVVGSVVDPITGAVLDPITGTLLDPITGSVLDPIGQPATGVLIPLTPETPAPGGAVGWGLGADAGSNSSDGTSLDPARTAVAATGTSSSDTAGYSRVLRDALAGVGSPAIRAPGTAMVTGTPATPPYEGPGAPTSPSDPALPVTSGPTGGSNASSAGTGGATTDVTTHAFADFLLDSAISSLPGDDALPTSLSIDPGSSPA